MTKFKGEVFMMKFVACAEKARHTQLYMDELF